MSDQPSNSKKGNSQSSSNQSMAYKSAGVDVEAGDELVDWLQGDPQDSLAGASPKEKKIQNELSKNLVSGIGGFASLFRADFASYKKPCLITCTDGVGTKVKLGALFNRYESLGQDCVAMCVNDLICTGGRPLLFLDYYASAKLDLKAAKSFLTGVRNACVKSHCLLVGGETAEMPGVYSPGDFDCAGFAVGVVDQDESWGPHKVESKDVLLAVASSGFHSNGYSLLRKLFEKDIHAWVEQLMEPTRLYVELAELLKDKVAVHACAHITGGGIDNIPRVLPESATWSFEAWKFPELFLEVQRRSSMTNEEMLKTLNCGVGLVLVLPSADAKRAQQLTESLGFQSWVMGAVD